MKKFQFLISFSLFSFFFFLFSLFSFLSPAWGQDSWSEIPILQAYYLEPQNLDDVEFLVSNRWFEKAWKTLEGYSDSEERVAYLKGAALMGLKRYEDSRPFFQKVSREGISPALRKKAKLMEAKVLARLSRYSEAMDIYDELLPRERSQILFWTAFNTALEAKNYERGLHYIRRFSGARAFWWRGWCHFRLGEDRHALNHWKLISRRERKYYLQSLYWQARIYEKTGEKEKAQTFYEDLARKYPLTYYGYLALKELSVGIPVDLFEDGEKQFWEHRYPRPYGEIVEAQTQKRKIDPNLIFSLIRQESSFREEAVSPAGAIGIMQLMPQTALRLAQAAKLKRFDLKETLRPEVNIHLGCMYVKFLMELFSGSLPHVLASYNAGEEAVSRWSVPRKKEPVEFFVEEIPYEETRNYIRRIVGNYLVYHWLYRQELPVAFLQ